MTNVNKIDDNELDFVKNAYNSMSENCHVLRWGTQKAIGLSKPGHWRHDKYDGDKGIVLLRIETTSMAGYDDDPLCFAGTLLTPSEDIAIHFKEIMIMADDKGMPDWSIVS